MRCVYCQKTVPLLLETYLEGHKKPLLCMTCNKNAVLPTADEFLRHKELGIVPTLRPYQIQLTTHLAQRFASTAFECIAIEAPCGMGKTFAYSLPAMLSSHRVVISTANKSLQDQLAHKDLPFLLNEIQRPTRLDATQHVYEKKANRPFKKTYTFACLKGRSNYFCKRRHEKAQGLYERHQQKELWYALEQWDETNSNFSDRDYCSYDLPPFAAAASFLDECRGTSCTFYNKCNFRRAKADARDADVLVINNTLLGYDLRFGPGKILPPYDILIVDEAHSSPDSLRKAFTETLSRGALKALYYDMKHLDLEAFAFTAEDWDTLLDAWQNLFDTICWYEDITLSYLPNNYFRYGLGTFAPIWKKLRQALNTYIYDQWLDAMSVLSDETPSMDDTDAVDDIITTGFQLALNTSVTFNKGDAGQTGEAIRDALLEKHAKSRRSYARMSEEEILRDQQTEANDAVNWAKRINVITQFLRATGEIPPNIIASAETVSSYKPVRYQRPPGDQIKEIQLTPVDLSQLVGPALKKIFKTCFFSGTLDVDELKAKLGLEPTLIGRFPENFDFTHTLFYMPTYLPGTKDPQYLPLLSREIVQLVRASQGCGLVLFGSRDELEQTYSYICDNFDIDQTPIIRHINAQVGHTKELFFDSENATLFALRSFFEGFDVPGDRLRLVVVTRAPFEPIDTALNQVQKKLLGFNPWFYKHYTPKMRCSVRQAFGRLVRREGDWGVVAMLDMRFWSSGSGATPPDQLAPSGTPWPQVVHNWQQECKKRGGHYGYKTYELLPFKNGTTNIEDVVVFYKNHLK